MTEKKRYGELSFGEALGEAVLKAAMEQKLRIGYHKRTGEWVEAEVNLDDLHVWHEGRWHPLVELWGGKLDKS